MSIEWKKSVALVRRLSFGLWKSRDRGDRGSCLGVKVKLRPQKRWRPLTRVVRNSAWEHLLLKYQAIISAAKTEPEWKLELSQPAIMHALLGSTHPLGQLREDLLRLFEERLRTGIGPAEWGADVHALLDVLQRCTLESCLLRANDRSGKFQVCECVERAAFEGNIAGAQEKVAVRESMLFYHAFAGISESVLEKDQVRASVTPSGKIRCMCDAIHVVSSTKTSADELLQHLICALLMS
ncbi:MAG: hypothetical protein SGPRY_009416 [Prymnesium sp.]